MNDLIGSIVSAVVLMIVALFGGAAVALKLSRPKREADETAFVEKETNLENANPHDLLAGSPIADDHRARTDALILAARKRIRDRARGVVSGNAGDGTPSGG
jgi:hypothetical protein